MTHKFLEPIQVGKQTLKNRIFLLAMAKDISTFDGKVSLRDVNYIRAIAEGGVGMVIPGAMAVDGDWPSLLPMQHCIFDDKFLPGITTLVRAAHEGGAKILLQLWHPGLVDYSGSGKTRSINDLSVDEIHDIQRKFVEGARRAMKAGADGVEFQTCHTYLANQFHSPLWNQRTDEYGCDSVENRTRFSVETIKMLREEIGPDKILSVKMQGFDYPKGESPDGNEGINPYMTAEDAPYIERAGADMITVSSGGSLLVGGATIMSGDASRDEGWKVFAASLVKKAVSIPVAASGSIRHPEYIDKIIANGDCDMVGMARGLFAEHNWVKKCEEGREDELRFCMNCMQCGNYIMAPDVAQCSINPYSLREGSKHELKKNGNGRVVAIVGAGPAGMEAAITLKDRGFEPVVFERRGEIGGNIHTASKPPFKGKFLWNVEFFKNCAKNRNIDIRLNTEATKENILALNPYAVCIAAGSVVSDVKIDGFDTVEVLQSRDVLDEEMSFAKRKIVVIGGGITGLETAEYLKMQGNEVHVVDFQPPFPLDNMLDPRYMTEAAIDTGRCMAAGVDLQYNHKVVKYADGKLEIEGVEDGVKSEIPADLIILSVGVKPADGLYKELKESGFPRVWKIGDALAPTKIYRAVQAGEKFAVALN